MEKNEKHYTINWAKLPVEAQLCFLSSLMEEGSLIDSVNLTIHRWDKVKCLAMRQRKTILVLRLKYWLADPDQVGNQLISWFNFSNPTDWKVALHLVTIWELLNLSAFILWVVRQSVSILDFCKKFFNVSFWYTDRTMKFISGAITTL